MLQKQGTLDATTLILEHSSGTPIENSSLKVLLGAWLHPRAHGCMLGVTSTGSWDAGKWPQAGDKWSWTGGEGVGTVSGTYSAVNASKGTFSSSWRCSELRMKSTIDVSVEKGSSMGCLVKVHQKVIMHCGVPASMVEKVSAVWQTAVFPAMRRYFEPESFQSSVIPHDERLQRVNDRLYFVRGYPYDSVSLTMTIYRMGDGNLWLHCVVPLGDSLMRALEALGSVSYIVVPNAAEPGYVAAYAKRYPHAKIVCPDGPTKKVFPHATTVEECLSRYKKDGMRAFTAPTASLSEWEELGISSPNTGLFIKNNFERVFFLDVGGHQRAICFGNLVSNLLESDRQDSMFGRGLQVPRAATLTALGFVKDTAALQNFFLDVCEQQNRMLSTFQNWHLVAFLSVHGAPVWRGAPDGMYSDAIYAIQFRLACFPSLPPLKLLGHEPIDIAIEGDVKEWSTSSAEYKARYLIVSKDRRCFLYQREETSGGKQSAIQNVLDLASSAGKLMKDTMSSATVWTRNLKCVFDLGGACVGECSPWNVPKAFEISWKSADDSGPVYWFEPSGKSAAEWIKTISQYICSTHRGYSMIKLRDTMLHVGTRAAELRVDVREDTRIATVLAFWFCLVDDRGDKTPIDPDEAFRFWFSASEFVDSRIRDLWSTLVADAQRGTLNSWAETDRGTLALIIVLDQFSRNIYRGHRKQFGGDELAYQIAIKAIDGGILSRLLRVQRIWILFPLMRREELASVERGVELLSQVVEEGIREGDPSANTLSRSRGLRTWSYQVELIKKFHRFPVRNMLLGRQNTPEETEYLQSSEQVFSSTSGFHPKLGSTFSPFTGD